MSLQLAAQHLAAQGRGNDSTLVHMTPNEVRGLQQIAKAAGGSLSVNPSTGLPEAGFLEDLMPAIIGGGLAVATGGASAAFTPAMIGLGIGGIQALRTGNLMDGVKAGLGAYGGAGLGAGMLGLGTQELGTQAALSGGDAAQAVTAAQASPFATAGKGLSTMFGGGQTAAGASGFGAGVDALGGVSGIAKTGLMGLAPALMSQDTPASTPMASDKDMGQRYSYSKNPITPFPQPNVPRAGSPDQYQSFGKEQQYFNPRYTKLSPEDAKALYGFAGGGPVEAMSNANALGQNTGYPMADINKGAYATPWQTPISRNVVNGAADTNVDQMTGEMKFADGGDTTIKYDPGKQQYEIIKESQSRSPTTQELVDAGSGVSSGGGGGGTSGSSGPSGSTSGANVGYGDFGMGAIGTGQALSSYGGFLGGMAPGGMLAGLIGAGLLSSGLAQLGEAEGDAATMGGVSGAGWGTSGDQGWGGEGGVGVGGDAGLGGLGYGGGDTGGYGGDAGGDGGGGGGDGGGGGEARGGLMHAYAAGGGYNLGDYSDGGRLLRGPGDGVSDSIPATIGKKQPARLADGEFVVPARIVSELGNGSTEAGARKLYAMMERVQSARGKTVGKGKVAKNSRAERYLPA